MGKTVAMAVLAFAVSGPAVVFGDDPPALRKGMWEYKRTLVGQGAGGKDAQIANKQCVDPGLSMKAMGEALAKQGCKVTPASTKGNVRTSIWECPMQGTMVRSESVLTVTSDSAYTVNITTSGGGKTNKEVLVAKRIGDC